MKKKLLSLLLVVAMLASLCAVLGTTASARYYSSACTCDEDWCYDCAYCSQYSNSRVWAGCPYEDYYCAHYRYDSSDCTCRSDYCYECPYCSQFSNSSYWSGCPYDYLYDYNGHYNNGYYYSGLNPVFAYLSPVKSSSGSGSVSDSGCSASFTVNATNSVWDYDTTTGCLDAYVDSLTSVATISFTTTPATGYDLVGVTTGGATVTSPYDVTLSKTVNVYPFVVTFGDTTNVNPQVVLNYTVTINRGNYYPNYYRNYPYYRNYNAESFFNILGSDRYYRNRSYYQNYTPEYTITCEAGIGGGVRTNYGKFYGEDATDELEVDVTEGNNLTVAFVPYDGFAVSDVIVDGKSIGLKMSYTFENVKDDHEVEVKFANYEQEKKEPSITVSPDFNLKDVSSSNWYYKYVDSLVGKGILTGYPDKTFRPTNYVTWGEALKQIMLAAGYEQQAAITGYHWASGYQKKALELGIMEKQVWLNSYISRKSIAAITANALNLGKPENLSPFTDDAPSAAVALYEANIITGSYNNDGELVFNGNDYINRAALAAIVNRIITRVVD